LAIAPQPQRTALLPTQPSTVGGGLGRHLHFDERSREFPVLLERDARIVTRLWNRRLRAFRQGRLNTCTGHAAMGVVCTEPYRRPGVRYSETVIRQIYTKATHHDTLKGAWPSKDTGSTVLAAMKALKYLGYTKGFRWCFSLEDVLKTLSTLGPVEVGVHWYEGFDRPDASGLIHFGGGSRGGHAFELLGVDAEEQRVWAINSWGPEWGQQGRFAIAWQDLDRLLHEDGEAATVVM
jgi:hypothetical protein